MLFDYLVVGVMLYSWKERIECKRTQKKYISWCLGLEKCGPGNTILEETKRDKISIRAGQRTMQYEERVRSETCTNSLKECLKEKEREATKTNNINEEWMQSSRHRSAKTTERKRGKNTKQKRKRSAKTNPIQQNEKG